MKRCVISLMIFAALLMLTREGTPFNPHDFISPKVAAGAYHTLFIMPDGTLWAWGWNGHGQLGDGNSGQDYLANHPLRIGADNRWVSIAAGYNHSLAIDRSGMLWGWGDNTYSQLGDETSMEKLWPSRIGRYSDQWAVIAAGGYHSLGIRKDGSLWVWGDIRIYQPGIGLVSSPVPIRIGDGNDKWTGIATGYDHSLAIKDDGSLWTWGDNSFGQFGDGTMKDRYEPVRVGTSLDKWTFVAAAEYHSFAIKNDGSLWAWGNNSRGQLGLGAENSSYREAFPVRVGRENDKWTTIMTGRYHSVSIKYDESLWAWGNNSTGQLGDGTKINRKAPVRIKEGKSIQLKQHVLAAGFCHSSSLLKDKDGYPRLKTWGCNSDGQLGDGSTKDRNKPVEVKWSWDR